jgi:hypothetical protein
MGTTPNGFGTLAIGHLTLITDLSAAEHANAGSPASRPRRQAGMRFIFVNGRTPRDDAHCALCCDKIGEAYVRETQTRLLYCDAQCYRGHVKFCQLGLESRARKVS